MEPITLLSACREHLLLPGESLADFREMWKKLTEADKADLTRWFEEIKIKIQPPKAA